MAHQVFICYASEDVDVARQVAAALEARGVKPWMAPDDIPPGEDYPGAIVRAIREAEAFVLLFTSHSNASHNVLKEVEVAAQRGKTITPVRLEDTQPSDSLAYFISTPQWIDAFGTDAAWRIDEVAATLAFGMKDGLEAKPEPRPTAGQAKGTPAEETPTTRRGPSRGLLVLIALVLLVGVWFVARNYGDSDNGGGERPGPVARTDPGTGGVPSDPEATGTPPTTDQPPVSAPDPDPAEEPDPPISPAPVELVLLAPEEGVYLDDREVHVRGTFTGTLPPGSLWVGAVRARIRGVSFEATLEAPEDGPFTFDVRCVSDHAPVEPLHREVIVDTQPPRLVLTSPAEGMDSVSSAELLVRGRLVEAHPAELRINDEPVRLDADGRFERTWTLRPGRRLTLAFEAEDRAGNAMRRVERNVLYEPRRVRIRVDAPDEGALLAEDVLDVVGRVVGAKGRVRIVVDGRSALTARDGTFSHSLRVRADGPLDVVVAIDDEAHSAREVTRRVIIDRTAPVLDVTTPSRQTTTAKSHVVVLSGRVREPHLEALTLNGEDIVCDSDGTFEWPVFVAAERKLSLRLAATDTLGHTTSRTYRVAGPSSPAAGRRIMTFHKTWASARKSAQRAGQIVFATVNRYKPP